MSRRAWNRKEEARLRELYPVTRMSELPALLGRSRSAIRNRATSLHLRKDPEFSMRRQWHADEDAVLRMLYADTPTDAIADQLRRSPSSTWQRARKLGLKKDPAYLASEAAGRIRRGDHRGRLCWFREGHVPANKGLRRPGYAPGRMAETQFKKGQATRWMPVGSERLVHGYRYTKVSDIRNVPWTRNWVATHILLWEKHTGRRLNRRTHALRFKNGNRSDIRIENLELITRSANMLRNSVHNLPAPLPETIQLLGALRRKINRRQRHHEEQDRRSA